jgi:chemotaxis protein MotA
MHQGVYIMDMRVFIGIAIAFAGVLIGFLTDEGHIGAIVQGSAALIVFGGTFGAVLVGSTKQDLRSAFSLFKKLFNDSYERLPSKVFQEVNQCAILARKESILQIEKRLDSFSHPFMSSVFRFVVDGVDPRVIKKIFLDEIRQEEEKQLGGAKLFMDAGGFAPTIGIIGAVLGLIHVMGNLTDTSKLGGGIAIAFVATLYGVGSANLVFIPIANKLKRIVQEDVKLKEMVLAGALSIVSGYNPYIIEEQLKPYLTAEIEKV